LLRHIEVPSDLDAANALRDSLGELVLASSLGQLRAGAQIGMNVELTTPSDATAQRMAEYREKAAAWNAQTGWGGMLEASLGSPTTSRRSSMPTS
jgi:hypothetical protein